MLSQQSHYWLPQLLQKATPTLSEATPTSTAELCGWLASGSDLDLSSLSHSHCIPSVTATPSVTCAQHLLHSHTRLQKLLLSATMTQDPEALAMLHLHRYIQIDLSLYFLSFPIMLQTSPVYCGSPSRRERANDYGSSSLSSGESHHLPALSQTSGPAVSLVSPALPTTPSLLPGPPELHLSRAASQHPLLLQLQTDHSQVGGVNHTHLLVNQSTG